MAQQLTFDFVATIDRELAEKAETERLESQQRNWDAILKSAVRDYPPENEEWDVILMGIRLAHHVHESECHRCKLGCFNHCPDALGMHWSDRYKQYTLTKVCLKDYFRWCAQHGLKHLVKEVLSGGR